MEVEISIEGEDVGTNNSIEGEVEEDEGGAFKEMSEAEMDSLEEEEIWRSRRKRIDNALAAVRNAEQQDPAEVYEAAQILGFIINHTNVGEFISAIESLAIKIDPSAIFNCLNAEGSSLLHFAALSDKDDVLRLLLDYVPEHLIAAQNDWGDTPLHMAIGAKRYTAARMLIRWTRNVPNVEDKNRILRMKNKRGNTPLHEAVLNGHVDGVRDLLDEDWEPVYWENAYHTSPLYLAVDSRDPEMQEVLFSLPLEPSMIQGLPPIHGAIMRHNYDLVALILRKNMKLFAMTDSRDGNVFHLAAYLNRSRVFEFLNSKTIYLAQQRDKNGDLPIHIASKMGHVELIEKLLLVSCLLNGQGQTILHVAAKYGRTSAVKYMLKHERLTVLINEADYAGNTPSHLATMYSQPAALIPLVMDERINPGHINHECLTPFDIAIDRFRREPTLRNQLTLMVVSCLTFGKSPVVSEYLLVLRPEVRDEAFSIYSLRKKKLTMDFMKDSINTRLLVATLVVTVTFAAGFTIPGGFNSSDTTSKDDRGMASMVDKRLFQAFAICNTIAMFCSMIVVINLIYAQQHDVEAAIAAYLHAGLPLIIALPAMSVAFLTGVTLTVGKLPWLANTIFYSGLVLLLIISGATLIEYPPFLWSYHRPIRRLIFWLVRAYIYFWGVQTFLLEDSEDGGTTTRTSASQPPDGTGDRMTDDLVTAKRGDAPHPPSH